MYIHGQWMEVWLLKKNLMDNNQFVVPKKMQLEQSAKMFSW
jgi:hypothetical protein